MARKNPLSRKYYVEIADIIKEVRESDISNKHTALDAFARQFANFAQGDNPRFDRKKFLKAAGVSSVTREAPPQRIKTISDVYLWLEHGPYAWPGGYPMYFIAEDGSTFNFSTVEENIESVQEAFRDNWSDWKIIAAEINYEDPDLFDTETGDRIECAYCDDDEEGDD